MPELHIIVHVPSARPAGMLLILGSVLFLAGAALPPEPSRVFSAALREHLDIVHRHAARWRWMNGLMIAGVLVTTAGLAVFTLALRTGGDSWRSTAGLFGYAMAGVLWVLSLAFRYTAIVSAAHEAARTDDVPSWLGPLQDWAGFMYWIYMIAAYVAIAMFGWAIVRSDVLSVGVGWFSIAYGYALGLSFVTKFPKTPWGPAAEPPFLIHIPMLVYGVALLVAHVHSLPPVAPYVLNGFG